MTHSLGRAVSLVEPPAMAAGYYLCIVKSSDEEIKEGKTHMIVTHLNAAQNGLYSKQCH